jgi:hypothetical protein
MPKFATHLTMVAAGPDVYRAVDGVVEIPDAHLAPFADLIACGWLNRFVEPAEAPAVTVASQWQESDGGAPATTLTTGATDGAPDGYSINLADGVSDAEAQVAGKTLNTRKKGKHS